MRLNSIFTTLQGKMSLFLVILAIIPALIIGYTANQQANSLLDTMTKNTHRDHVIRVADRLEQYLHDGQASVATLAKTPYAAAFGSEDQTAVLRSFYEGNGMFELVFCVDAQGQIKNTWPQTDFGGKKDFSDRQWYKDVAAAQKPVISDTYVSAFTKQATAPVVAPLVNNAGQIIGYIGGNLKLGNVTELAKGLNAGNTGKGVVLDKKSYYLTDSRDETKSQQHELFNEQDVIDMTKSQEAQTKYLGRQLTAFAPVGQTGWAVLSFQNIEETMSNADDLRNLIIVVVLLSCILLALIGFFAVRRISRPITAISSVAAQIAGGHIVTPAVTYTGQDEIRQLVEAFQVMAENIRQLIRQTGDAADATAISADQLAASSKQSAEASGQIALSAGEVAAGSETQRQAVDDATLLVQSISDKLQHIVSVTDAVVNNSQGTAKAAEDGNTKIELAVRQMNAIETTVANLAEVVGQMGEQSGEIGQIIDTISGIAKQTNLLALNAAIESARAGEHGRGFAVVAEEVKKLAEQSEAAAAQIAGLITAMQTSSGNAVAAMSDGSRQVQSGSETVRAAGVAFGEIVALIETTKSGIGSVAEDVQQMASAGAQIAGQMENIDRISRENAAHVQSVSAATEEQSAALEEIAASSQELQTMSENVRALTRKFTIS
ncbi:methyl-accepting chemotaxis protein [Sporomusa aerivorans]|uniref:methyl-accepting chemotaxis protein n=1 Tax=Sporomusa aerivorans TaxID=204936 RepID=UPI00352A454C